METGMGARSQPLSLVISTAGVDIGSPCYEDWQICEKILSAEIEEEQTFCIIYAADREDAWDSEEALKKANPNYGVSVSIERVKTQLNSARHSAARRAAYETKHLNRWVQSGAGFMNMALWDKCATTFNREEDFKGLRAWAGVDLAEKVDIASVRYLIELGDGRYATWGRNYLHAEAIARAENAHYRRFVECGSLTECPGNCTDFDMILEDIMNDAELFDLQEIACDPKSAGMFMKRLESEGFKTVVFMQGAKYMNEPMRTIESDVAGSKLAHDNCPMLNWMTANVTVDVLGKYIYPKRSNKTGKIDGFVALVMARGLSGQDQQEQGYKSIFERGGLNA
jgi:phage terminase large subunit-like protein